MLKTKLNVSFPEEEEILLPIPGYEGLYSVSNMGRIFSHKSNRYLRPDKNNWGYLYVGLYKDGQVKKTLVHRIVLKAFRPTSDPTLQVNHKDGDKENNSLENLDWVSGSENIRHSFNVLGNEHGLARKAVAQHSIDGIRIGVFRSAYEASRATGVNYGNIWSCAKGRLKHAGGFVWKFLSEEKEEAAAA